MTSDLHGYLPNIPECDLLLIAGDVTPAWNHERQFQADWLRSEFKDWMADQPARTVIWTGGNHDFVLQDWRNKPHKRQEIGGLYLDNSWLEIPGLGDLNGFDRNFKIWGSPMSNKFGNWCHMRPEDQLAEIWRTIPRDIDVLMVHGPVYGYGDLVPAMSWSAEKRGWVNHGEHVGSTSLYNQLNYEEWPNLKLIVSGHIHEAFGHYQFKNYDVYNVAYLDGEYRPTNEPVVIDF